MNCLKPYRLHILRQFVNMNTVLFRFGKRGITMEKRKKQYTCFDYYYDSEHKMLALRKDQELFDIDYGHDGVKVQDRVYYYNPDDEKYYFLDLKTYRDYPAETVNKTVAERSEQFSRPLAAGFAEDYFVVENPAICCGLLDDFFEPYTYSGTKIDVDFTDEITNRTAKTIGWFLTDERKFIAAAHRNKALELPDFSGRLTYEIIDAVINHKISNDIIKDDVYESLVRFIDFMKELGIETDLEYPMLQFVFSDRMDLEYDITGEMIKRKYQIDVYIKNKLFDTDAQTARKCLYDKNFWQNLTSE